MRFQMTAATSQSGIKKEVKLGKQVHKQVFVFAQAEMRKAASIGDVVSTDSDR